MTYLDKYPNCINCPVSRWCGTAVSSIRLCHSYKESDCDTKSVLTLSKAAPKSEEEYAEEKLGMWDNKTD